MKRLIALYPAHWRQRYGAEMARLLDDLAPLSPAARLRVAADLILGALGAHVSKEFRMTSKPGRVIRRGAIVAAIAWAARRPQPGIDPAWARLYRLWP